MRKWYLRPRTEKNEFIIYTFTRSSNFEFCDCHIPLFDEDSAYNKSIKRPVEGPEETKVPRIHDTTMNNATQQEYREIEVPQVLETFTIIHTLLVKLA